MKTVMRKSYPWGATVEEIPIKAAEISYEVDTMDHMLCLHTAEGIVYEIPMEKIQRLLGPVAQSIAKALDKPSK